MIEESYKLKAREIFEVLGKEMLRLGQAPADWCNPGLTEEEISINEKRLGIVLPDEIKACYSLSNGAFGRDHLDVIHSGESYTGFYLSPLGAWGGEEDMELIEDMFYERDGINDTYQDMPTTVTGPAKATIHHRKWIAITMPSAWYSWYVDFDPEPGGKMGQVLFVTSNAESIHVEVVASNFFDFMEILIESAQALWA